MRFSTLVLAASLSLLATTGGMAEEELVCGSNGPVMQDGSVLAPPEGAHIFNWLAHGVFRDREQDQLRDGYVISLEKFKRSESDVPDDHHRVHLLHHADLQARGLIDKATARTRNRWTQRAFDDKKPLVVTHITRFQDRSSCTVMNMYGPTDMPMCQTGVQAPKTYDAGMTALQDDFTRALGDSIRSGKFTHIFFMAMGWNNDQRVSLCRYRKIVDEVTAAVAREGETIRPLIVGMTWPSSWNAASTSRIGFTLGHIGSVFNKATDSDEAGLLYGNLILNRLIPTANSAKLPVVVVGHSFGTRLAGQALFQRDLLREGPIGDPAELALFLQPAHSVFRYDPDRRGREGHPFGAVRDIATRVVVTSSPKDSANPWAFWTRYLGGKGGLRWAAKFSETYHDLAVQFQAGVTPPRVEKLDTRVGVVNLINAEGFVEGHSDILDEEIGAVFARLLLQHAR